MPYFFVVRAAILRLTIMLCDTISVLSGGISLKLADIFVFICVFLFHTA